MIRLENVTKRYKTGAGINTILNNVSLTFPKGHSVGILGGNGAGKSTLIRIIGNAEPPDSGRIIRHGRVSWPLGFTGGFQSNMTARENARFVARIYGESIDYIESFTEEFSELGKYFDVPLRSYSAGMRARFAFSVSLAWVSHNEQTIRRNCDMAAILHDGRIDMYDDLKEAMHSYKLLQTNAA